MNLLSDRLKFAKRELTALKTSHARGLGNLKVYEYRYDMVVDPSYDFRSALITVTFDDKYAKFPFVSFSPTIDVETGLIWIRPVTFDYADDGRKARFSIRYLYLIDTQNFFIITSTAPITNIDVEWQ